MLGAMTPMTFGRIAIRPTAVPRLTPRERAAWARVSGRETVIEFAEDERPADEALELRCCSL